MNIEKEINRSIYGLVWGPVINSVGVSVYGSVRNNVANEIKEYGY